MPHHKPYSDPYETYTAGSYDSGGHYPHHYMQQPAHEDLDDDDKDEDDEDEDLEEEAESEPVENDVEDEEDDLDENEDDDLASEPPSLPPGRSSALEDEEDEEEEEIAHEEEEIENVSIPDEEDDEPRRKCPKSLAFAYLQGQASHSNSTLSEPAQSILQALLEENGFVHQESEADVTSALALIATHEEDEEEVVMVDASSLGTDAAIVERTRKHTSPKISYLKTFLAVLEEELAIPHREGVPARVLIKQACLAIRPEFIPAVLDAEEMAMATLEFLASTCTVASKNVFPNLPLIRAVKEENDIKKRVYVKSGNWESDAVPLSELERILFQDATSYKWLRRGAFAPRMEDVDDDRLDPLFRKGRHKIVTAPPKRKAAAPKRTAGKARDVASASTSFLGDMGDIDDDDGE